MTGWEEPSGLLGWATAISLVLLAVAMALSFVRLALGPTLPDRVVALDLIAILAVGFLGIFAIAAGERAFLDVAVILALVAFLGTVAFARYAERRAAGEGASDRGPGDE
ncbi:MAG: monovalent cation/H+ antiporter complex subunit F [Inquilinaceae bacterium]